MLKGVLPKSLAYLGIAAFVGAVVGWALQPVLGIAYLWWWFLFMILFVAVGWRLYRLGGSASARGATNVWWRHLAKEDVPWGPRRDDPVEPLQMSWEREQGASCGPSLSR